MKRVVLFLVVLRLLSACGTIDSGPGDGSAQRASSGLAQGLSHPVMSLVIMSASRNIDGHVTISV